MPKRNDGTSRSPGRESGGPAPLPNLSGFDLRTLRMSDESAVADAVEWALRGPELFQTFWAADGGTGKTARCGGRSAEERHSVPGWGAEMVRDPANLPL